MTKIINYCCIFIYYTKLENRKTERRDQRLSYNTNIADKIEKLDAY